MQTQKDVDYFLDNPNEELTDEQTALLLLGGHIEGDTNPEETAEEVEPTGKESGAAPEAAKESESEGPAKAAEQAILAKDGKNTIPYSELESARADAKRWEQVANEKEAFIQSLEAAKKIDAETGTTDAQEDVLAGIREDYPALAEAMEKAIDAKVERALKPVQASIQPTIEVTQDTLRERHFSAINGAHPDFPDLYESGKLDAFVKSQPSFMRPEFERVMEKGNAQEIIDLVAAYKERNPSEQPQPKPSKEELAKAAEAAIRKVGSDSSVPNSLTDVPSAGMHDSEELGSMDSMSDTGLLGAMMSMSPDKINEKLSRLL